MNNNTNNTLAALTVANLAANANKPASAGLLGRQLSDLNQTGEFKPTSTFCLNTQSVAVDTESKIFDDKLSHQIGTNLTDLSACWQKMNQEGDSTKEKSEDETESSLLWSDSASNSDVASVSKSSLDSLNETRKSFQDEFSSLILKSDNLKSLIRFDDQVLEQPRLDSDGRITSNFKAFSSKDLIEQVALFNKYNNSNFTKLSYTPDTNNTPEENSGLVIRGMIKIHWNLKNPIKLSQQQERTEEETGLDSGSEISIESNHNNFKATSIKDLNQKKMQQTSWDDCSVGRSSNENEKGGDNNSALFRFQTVRCKTTSRWKRSPIHPIISQSESNSNSENEMFIPSYGSVSSICIDNSVSCLKAISILFDKFHISTQPNLFSLYKVYQSGHIQELGDNDFLLLERLWMGPFTNEDRVFIMEKGRRLGVRQQEAAPMICLPHEFLLSLMEKSKQEELKEIGQIKLNYKKYSDNLKACLKSV